MTIICLSSSTTSISDGYAPLNSSEPVLRSLKNIIQFSYINSCEKVTKVYCLPPPTPHLLHEGGFVSSNS